ncbi:MAG: class I SAM-dependent methyltransferase [Thermodesulfobacteriota bacterium]
MDEGLKYENYLQALSLDRPKSSRIDLIRRYWNVNIHDIEITKYPVGAKDFFDELESHRSKKLEYLAGIVGLEPYGGKKLLDVGCGVGVDLVRFAKRGAIVTGIDLADRAIQLARKNLELHGVKGELLVMDGEEMSFKENSFDVVFVHGVLGYTNDPMRMTNEVHRVLKPGGEAILMVYHRNSWLFFGAELFGVKLGREDAPVFMTHSMDDFKKMLMNFSHLNMFTVRFPVKTQIHKGIKGKVFNYLFVPAFNLVPKSMVNSIGAHLIAKVIK